MKPEIRFRRPNDAEKSLLERLLEADFPARNELAPMLSELLVRTIDDDGSLELQSQISGAAAVVKRIPVEAEAMDEDQIVIHVLLHTKDGRPSELEIFREDGSPVRQMPPASKFELIVLPPIPSPRRELNPR